MAARGFCPHGKVWTTCPICGKEVIASLTKRGSRSDDFLDQPRPARKRPPPADEDTPTEPEAESSDSSES